jgi:Tol biopolymer transport system component
MVCQVYIVDITGQNPPKELTSGKQGAIHSPVINAQGTRAAWLELDEDGYESDRQVNRRIGNL